MGNRQNVQVKLPQNDDETETRRQNLQSTRNKYQLQQPTFGLTDLEQRLVNIVNLPPMLREFPKEEKRSFYFSFFNGLRIISGVIYMLIFGRGKWTIQQMIRHFRDSKVIKEPKGCEVWRKEEVDGPNQTQSQRAQADHWFAWQRMNGLTRNLIRKVQTIPEQFVPFVNIIEENHPYLAGKTLETHIQQGTLFVVDLTEISLNEPTLLSTMALFGIYKDVLMPVAVWMNIKDVKDGKVYTPRLNGDNTEIRQWVKMRMWFNMLEGQYHTSITHVGFTHFLMEGVSICIHRNLSDRHPIYKILLPHFQFMHAGNKFTVDDLFPVGAHFDKGTYIGRVTMLRLISKHNENWAYSTHASLLKGLETRGVKTIPGYFFKDDALLLHKAIHQFVYEYAAHYYGNDDVNVQQDNEIQSFRQELLLPRKTNGTGGCGMNGIPEFTSIENLVEVLTNIIYICSVEHSVSNFPAYDHYAFPPNMPDILHGQPEDEMNDLDEAMPTGKEIFYTIGSKRTSSQVLTSSLGNYDDRYLKTMDNDGKAFVEKFQQNLLGVTEQINQRNNDITAGNNGKEIKEYPFEWLLPENVLNSINV
ncbi:allene oxide synthase-lipoxygenase protein [Magallana gigas]|uniref:allene oxide synthase-lipoxygenase protein n=1 Tax=Magallana gigas TaxID=29159 RepID=UPI0033407754